MSTELPDSNELIARLVQDGLIERLIDKLSNEATDICALCLKQYEHGFIKNDTGRAVCEDCAQGISFRLGFYLQEMSDLFSVEGVEFSIESEE